MTGKMAGTDARMGPRRTTASNHRVVVRRDSYARSLYKASRKLLGRQWPDLTAEVADTSEGGLRLRFHGQRAHASGLFERDGEYLLSISLGHAVVRAPTHLIRGNAPHLQLKTICRWHRPGADRSPSAVGFAFAPDNDVELLAFVSHGLGEPLAGDSITATDWLPFSPT